jgi:hypothetical protein
MPFSNEPVTRSRALDNPIYQFEVTCLNVIVVAQVLQGPRSDEQDPLAVQFQDQPLADGQNNEAAPIAAALPHSAARVDQDIDVAPFAADGQEIDAPDGQDIEVAAGLGVAVDNEQADGANDHVLVALTNQLAATESTIKILSTVILGVCASAAIFFFKNK